MIRGKSNLAKQMKRSAENEEPEESLIKGDVTHMISTGSTLLDLAIAGGRVRGGGIPGGIMVEIFGPSGTGKTVLLCEIAGDVQRKGGDIMFRDPEARLNKQFAKIFDLEVDTIAYDTPNTIPEVFKAIREWTPKKSNTVNGIMADSLAALSTDLEMNNDTGDKMGMRRAKEFSEELRKTARILAAKNFLLVASNQVRINTDMFGPKYNSPGGEAIGFYSSLRLQIKSSAKIKKKVSFNGKEVTKVIGVTSTVVVFKNSVDAPYREANISIIFDYGIDDVMENLQYLKKYKGSSVYTLGDRKLNKSLDRSIRIIEREGLENELKEEVINVWEEIEKKFASGRQKKR